MTDTQKPNAISNGVKVISYRGYDFEIRYKNGEVVLTVLQNIGHPYRQWINTIRSGTLRYLDLSGTVEEQLIEAAQWAVDAPVHFTKTMDILHDLGIAKSTRSDAVRLGDPQQPQRYEYQDSIVAFIDILGFRNLVGKGAVERISQALYALDQRRHNIDRWKHRYGEDDVNITMFSDSIIVSHPRKKYGAQQVCYVTGFIARELFELDVLCRGAIIKGDLYHKQGISFGPSLIQAYELESSTAVYPRILVSPDVVHCFHEDYIEMFSSEPPSERWFIRDHDGLDYIDMFDTYYLYWKATGEHEISDSEISDINCRIQRLLDEAGGNMRVMAKLIWLQSAFVRSVSRIPKAIT